MTSTELTKLIIDLSRKLPYANRMRLWRNNTGTAKKGKTFIKFGEKGAGDIIGWGSLGQMVMLEIKIGKDKQSTEQREFQDQLNATTHGSYWLVRDEASAMQALDHIAGLDGIPW